MCVRQVVVAETDQGRGILGLVDDGMNSKGIKTEADIKARLVFLRKISYKPRQ